MRKLVIILFLLTIILTEASARDKKKTLDSVSNSKLYAEIEPEKNLTGFMDYTPKPPKADEEKEIHFSADEMETNQESQDITALGNVEIIRDNLTLKADKVTYNQKTDVVTASGNVVLLEETGNVVFSDHIVLSDKMSKGEMRNIKIIMRDKTRISAASARRLENDDKIMRGVTYSPCDACKTENPLWQLKSRKVTHDAKNKDINYKDAFLEVKGVPIFYTPYLSHPDPSVKRRTGFLPPTIKSNSYLGAAIKPSYFWNVSDHEDVTFTPILTTDQGVVLGGGWRKHFYNGDFDLNGSIMEDQDDDETRGHLFLKGRYEVNDYWVASTDIKHVSDRNYLKDLSLDNRDNAWLTSNAKLEGFDNRNYAAVEAYYYKLISYDMAKLDKPYVVPMMSYENISDPGKHGSYTKTQLDFASVLRQEENSEQRATMINSWVLPYTSPYGEKYRLQASLKSDVYYVDNYLNENNRYYDGSVARAMPQVGMEWKLPFVRANENSRQILEPTVVAVAAPRGGNKKDKIPNDDSLYSELDDTNILNLDRYAGYDRNDDGSRVSYGLNWSAYGDQAGRASAFIAQSYAFSEYNEYTRSYDGKFSDYVGRAYASPNQYLDLNYRFRMDKDDYELKYSELSANFGPPILNGYVGYIFLKEDLNKPISTNNKERKELLTILRTKLTKDWSLAVYNRQDLAPKGGSLEYGGDLTYEDECLKLITNMRRNNSNDPDFEGDFEISVNFLLKTLGGFGSK